MHCPNPITVGCSDKCFSMAKLFSSDCWEQGWENHNMLTYSVFFVVENSFLFLPC